MSKINIFMHQSKYLIFDLEKSIFLKETRRICARLIGIKTNTISISNSQSSINSVPLQLSLEELCLLIENFPDEVNLVKITYPNLDKIDLNEGFSQLKSNLELYLKKSNQKQFESYRIERNNQLYLIKDKILDGKRKKLTLQLTKIEEKLSNPNLLGKLELEKLEKEKINFKNLIENLEENFNKELNNQLIVSNETEIFVETPEFYDLLFSNEVISTDNFRLLNLSSFKTCKYLTFKYLWSNGFYLTGGSKFGGDFLVYPGEPSKYHSQYILICMENLNDLDSLTLKDLITYARMATTVKKTFLISYCSYLNSNNNSLLNDNCFSIFLNDGITRLNLISLNWSHI